MHDPREVVMFVLIILEQISYFKSSKTLFDL